MSAPRTGRGPRALSRFFARHNACGGGFDVGRPAGGLVRVTCTGCGEEFVYETAAGSLPEGSAMPASALNPIPDEAELDPGDEIADEVPGIADDGPDYGPGWSPRRRGSEEATEYADVSEAAPEFGARSWRPRLPLWLSRPYRWRRPRLPHRWVDAVVVAAMLFAVAIIVLGVTGGDDEGSDDRASSGVEAEPAPGTDAGSSGAAAEEAADEERSADDRRAGTEDAIAASGGEVDLGRARTFFSAYRIAIPKSWDVIRHSSFVQFSGNGGSSDVRVYYEQRSTRPAQMEGELREFLKSEHRGADIGELERTRVAGAEAASLTARYGGSVETATLVAEQPYLYLVVTRLSDSASEEERAAATAVLNSFRPA